MTLRDTELLGKKLVRPLGFRRYVNNHHHYHLSYKHIYIEIKFYGGLNTLDWKVEVIYKLNYGTDVVFRGDTLDIDNIIPDANKLIAVFNFIRS
jgi:hypothetical protein